MKTKVSHTPPLDAAESGNGIQIIDGNDQILCEFPFCGDHPDRDAMFSLACQMAAAPELLAALEKAVAMLRMEGGYEETVLQADAAIAKARGE